MLGCSAGCIKNMCAKTDVALLRLHARYVMRSMAAFIAEGFGRVLSLQPDGGTFVAPATVSLRLKIAEKPYRTWSLGPKTFYYVSLEP